MQYAGNAFGAGGEQANADHEMEESRLKFSQKGDFVTEFWLDSGRIIRNLKQNPRSRKIITYKL